MSPEPRTPPSSRPGTTEQARAANARLREELGSVANDLNDLVTLVMGYSDLMLARVPPHDTLRTTVESIKSAAVWGGSLVQQLLTLIGRDLAPLAPDGHSATADRRETVLVVDDEGPVREMIRDVLRMHGYTVLEARDGDMALAVSERHDGPIDLLIADLVMPGMPRTSLTEQLVMNRPALKMLFISGYTNEVARMEGLAGNGDCFLEKPFTVDALAQKVREVLDGVTDSRDGG